MQHHRTAGRLAAAALILAFALLFLSGRAEAGLSFQPLRIPDGDMRLMDLDGDSLSDIVLSSYTGLSVFFNHPDSGFSEEPDFTFPVSGFASDTRVDFTLADVDGDSLLDVFRVDERAVSVFFQRKGRAFPREPDLTAPIPEGEWLVDLGDVDPAPGLEVVTLGAGGVKVRTLSADRRSLSEPAVISDVPPFLSRIGTDMYARRWPCPWNFCMDADGDGLDDVFVPRLSSVLLLLQKPKGKFDTAYTLDMPVIVELDSAVPSGPPVRSLDSSSAPYLWTNLQAPSIECRDVNGDGRRDVVLAEVFGFLQDEHGGFPRRDDFRAPRAKRPERKPLSVTELVNEYVDVNGDGVLDRVSQYRPWSTGAMKSDVKIYFGDGKRDLYAIDPDKDLPDNKVVGENFLFEAQLADLDGDGALDIFMFDTDYKITEVANWVQINRGDIRGEVCVYFFDKKRNRYDNRKGYTKDVRVHYEIKTFEIFQDRIFDYVQTMMTVMYDFTGDGRNDLMVRGESTEKGDVLFIYRNTGRRKDLFSKRPTAVLRTPRFHHFGIMDINSDGVDDFVLYDSADRRVGILLSWMKKGL